MVGGKQALCPLDYFATGIARRCGCVECRPEFGCRPSGRNGRVDDCTSGLPVSEQQPNATANCPESFVQAGSCRHRAVTSVKFHDVLSWLERSWLAAVCSDDTNHRSACGRLPARWLRPWCRDRTHLADAGQCPATPCDRAAWRSSRFLSDRLHDVGGLCSILVAWSVNRRAPRRCSARSTAPGFHPLESGAPSSLATKHRQFACVKVHCWLVPPWQGYWISGVRRAVEALVTSRHRPLFWLTSS